MKVPKNAFCLQELSPSRLVPASQLCILSCSLPGKLARACLVSLLCTSKMKQGCRCKRACQYLHP